MTMTSESTFPGDAPEAAAELATYAETGEWTDSTAAERGELAASTSAATVGRVGVAGSMPGERWAVTKTVAGALR